MAHFARIDENNIVTEVLVVDDKWEHMGQHYLAEVCGLGGTWIQTSYNTYGGVHSLGGTPLRKNFAGIGYIYDKERDAFYLPQPYPSWTLNTQTFLWEAPVPYPTDGGVYTWDEATQSWVPVAG